MCGVAGFFSKKHSENETQDILSRMVDSFRWRGPDDKGVYLCKTPGYTGGLAHRRLSIMDLSERGKQPMTFAEGRYVLSYNGEIYNYRSIRKQLEELGHVFISDCDTEVVLHACAEYGVIDAVKKFNGMWALAFYDRDAAKLTLSRDRLGVKPLYYSFRDSTFSFASDLRAFFECPDFDNTINTKALHGYIWNMYIPAPFSIFQCINKVPQGCAIEYNLSELTISEQKYWDFENVEASFRGTYDEYVDSIENVLKDSVGLRLVADVPVGVFLSGGIDSSLVASLAQEQTSNTINTYSIGFKEKENDDAKVAAAVATHLGTRHLELFCTQQDALDLIMSIPRAYSEPFADNSQLPTMLLSRMTKEHVTVALSGDGGDEFFLGYPMYLSKSNYLKQRQKTRFLNPLLRVASGVASKYSRFKWLIDKYYHSGSLEESINLDYISAMGIIDTILDTGYTREQLSDQYGGTQYGNMISDPIRALDYHSIQYGLTDDMLVKVDRASMYYSLECRCPILDYRVVELALSAPIEYNLHGGVLKSALKEILYRRIPREMVERPKEGFGVPINKWIHEELLELVNDHLSETTIRRQGLFEVEGTATFLKEFNRQNNPILDRIAYTMLMFQLWWNEYEGIIKK